MLGVLFGDPGAGKSILALDWAASVATGTNWHDRKVAPGAVIYAAGEGYGGIARRLKAWEVHHSKPASPDLHISRRGVAFNDPQSLGGLVNEIDAMPNKPILIVVDTLARAIPGMDDKDSVDIGKFVRACNQLQERYGCAVLVVHHSGHGDKTRGKGAIDLRAATDAEAGLVRTTEEHVIRLFCTKQKDGEAFKDINLRFKSVPLPWIDEEERQPQYSVVLVPCDAPPSAPKATKAKRQSFTSADRLLILCLGTERISKEIVRKAFFEQHGASDEATRQAWSRALRRGRDEGWFTDDGAMLTPNPAAILRDKRDSEVGPF